jgi:ribonuclease T2
MARPSAKAALALLAVALCLCARQPASAQRNTAGMFDYYVLVLSWSPSYCEKEGRDRHDRQCDGGKPRAFTLHGLWPQYERGWPENCPIGKRPWVPAKVIDEIRDIMPSKNLIIHEYRTHGTCSGLDPAQYFGVARELYERVAVPPALLSAAPAHLSPKEIEQDFAEANPWLKPDTMAVSCRGDELIDVRICFGRDLFPRPCGANEDAKRLCPVGTVTVPPVAP